MVERAQIDWPALPEVAEPAPAKERRAWGKLPHSERYRRQRRDLLRAAARLAARTGYSGARVAEIVTEAGLSKSTFYEHFASKQECFVELYRSTSAEMLRAGVEAAEATIDAGAYECLLTVIRALVGYPSRDPRLAEAFRADLGDAEPAMRAQRAANTERIVGLFATIGRRLGATLEDDDLVTTAQVVVRGAVEVLASEQPRRDLDLRLRSIARLACRSLDLAHP